MPPTSILDLAKIDLTKVLYTSEQIYAKLPHRFEFMLLDGVVHFDAEARIAIGYHDVREDEWWVKGHIPGRPLFPGVLMVETAAHLASFISSELMHYDKFLGFGGIDETKFREAVSPPARLYIVGHATQVTMRRTVCEMQGFAENRMVFHSQITGMML